MTKLSMFFNMEDGLKNRAGIQQEVPANKVYLYNMNYSASRLDLIKFALDEEFKIIDWFLEEKVADKLGVHIASASRKGLAITFRSESANNRNLFELIKNKVLGKNSIKLSVAELIFNEAEDNIYISFKTNVDIEQSKIGIIEKNQPFRWMYLDGVKVVRKSEPTNGRPKAQSHKPAVSKSKEGRNSKPTRR